MQPMLFFCVIFFLYQRKSLEYFSRCSCKGISKSFTFPYRYKSVLAPALLQSGGWQWWRKRWKKPFDTKSHYSDIDGFCHQVPASHENVLVLFFMWMESFFSPSFRKRKPSKLSSPYMEKEIAYIFKSCLTTKV